MTPEERAMRECLDRWGLTPDEAKQYDVAIRTSVLYRAVLSTERLRDELKEFDAL